MKGMTAHPLVLDFSEIGKNDTEIVGGKSANSGEMISIGLPVPSGFATTTYAYDLFMQENKLNDYVYKTLNNINFSSEDELDAASASIRRKILSGVLPEALAKEVIKHYKKMGGFGKSVLVAVRSSATAEDMPGTSFAGQQETFLNIKGESNVNQKIKECFASLFKARSIYYRHINKIPHETVRLSAMVQKMVQSEVSGVMFSIDPMTNQKDRIVIESVWGLGEMIVQGSVIPDTYVVQKETFDILSKVVSDQSVQLVKVGTETKQIPVSKKQIDKQKLSDKDIIKLAKYADTLQKHYYYPQDAEWAKEGDKLYIVQTRPVTTISKVQTKKTVQEQIEKLGGDLTVPTVPVLTGSPASPGLGIGKVKIIKSAKEISKVAKGDVLVAVMTSPDFVPAMKKASAIVTDQGGQTSHAAIVSRELGVPCVVGTKNATAILVPESIITVNGTAGEVFLGGNIKHTEVKKEVYDLNVKTATRLYVNLAEPERAKEIAKLPVDGVGLLRAEFMMANIGIHPKEAIKLKVQEDYVDKLAKGLTEFAREFYPRPVVYRASDLKTNEYRALKGGKYWEPEEPNPLLGFRGAARYVANPEVFNLELSAIKKVREKYNNLHLMIPFVRSPLELSQVRRIVATEGLFEEKTFKFWMMTELPVNIILLDEFIKVGIDGVSIGSNDLTMLLLGTDRDNAEVARQFDERSPAVIWALDRIIKTCNEKGITVSICGQAPSQYDDLVEKLVKMGITSISVNPDSIGRAKHIISEAEKKILR